MSKRAIQRLRDLSGAEADVGGRLDKIDDEGDGSDDSDDSDDDDSHGIVESRNKASVFMYMDDDSDSQSDSDSDDIDHDDNSNDDDDDDDVGDTPDQATLSEGDEKDAIESPGKANADESCIDQTKQNTPTDNCSRRTGSTKGPGAAPVVSSLDPQQDIDSEEAHEEDLDDLLDEFRQQDVKISNDVADGADTSKATGANGQRSFAILTEDLYYRDFDMNNSMKTTVQGVSANPAKRKQQQQQQQRRRQDSLFGYYENKHIRPPHYIAGGIGMQMRDDQQQEENENSAGVPWPYGAPSDISGQTNPNGLWHTFVQSDSYKTDLSILDTIVNSGDPNALCMFVADKPFVPEALIKLVDVVYGTNQKEAALKLLRRALWVHECATQPSFLKFDGTARLLDFQNPQNETFFLALFQLVRVSRIHGVITTALAASRFLLSLDPLRDPMAILLLLDNLSLTSTDDSSTAWFVGFVESNTVKLCHKTSEGEFYGSLLELPNLAYSYALALHHLAFTSESSDDVEKSTNALVEAIYRFPSVVPNLLDANKINLAGRSTNGTEWMPVVQQLHANWGTIQSQSLKYDGVDEGMLKRSALSAANKIIIITQ